MIALTRQSDSTPVYVSPLQIKWVENAPTSGARIQFVDGTYLDVEDEPMDIYGMLGPTIAWHKPPQRCV